MEITDNKSVPNREMSSEHEHAVRIGLCFVVILKNVSPRIDRFSDEFPEISQLWHQDIAHHIPFKVLMTCILTL